MKSIQFFSFDALNFQHYFNTTLLYKLVQKPVKTTGTNIVVFCMLITILNTFLITLQDVLHLLF